MRNQPIGDVMERRGGRRHKALLLLRVQEPDGQWRWNFLYNISHTGMKVYLFAPCEPGEEVRMELFVPEIEEALPVSAQVIWTGRDGTGFTGMRFATVPSELRRWLEHSVGPDGCHTGYPSPVGAPA